MKKILIAEDNVFSQKITQKLLIKRGWNVTIAGNGRSVVKAAKNEFYNIILMDINMPLLNGLNAAKQIRKYKKSKELPILAFTSLSIKDNIGKFLRAGMDGYISKPINEEEFFSMIERFTS